MSADRPVLQNVPLRGGAVLESPSGLTMDLRWLTYGHVADAELVERPGPGGRPGFDPNLADVAVNTLQQVADDLARQGVTLRFTVEDRPGRPDQLGRTAAGGAGFESSVELVQLRARVEPGQEPGPAPDSLAVRAIVDGDDWEPLARIHSAALSDTFQRSTDTPEGTRARLAGNHQSPFSVNVVADPEVAGQYVGMVATGLFRASPSSPAVGEISLLAVDPDWRKRGLGRHLVQYAKAALAEAGARTAMAYVEPTNEVATRLFESEGFAPRATRIYFSR